MFKVDLSQLFLEVSANEKMEYFFVAVYNNEVFYTFMSHGNLILCENTEGIVFLPVYPSRSTAGYAREASGKCVDIEAVSLETFFEHIRFKLKKRDVQLGVFYDGDKGILISMQEFEEAMEA